MPDNLRIPGPQDPSTISLNERHEVGYWMKRLQRSEDELRYAVEAVGNSVDAVTNWFQHKELVQTALLNLEQLNYERQIRAEEITRSADAIMKLLR